MAAFDFHRRKTRRGWIAGATAVAMVVLVVVFAAGSGAAPSKVARLATTPTTTTDCNGQSLSANPYVTTDLLKGSNFEIDAAVPPPANAKKGTLPTKGSNEVVDTSGCLDWVGVSGSSNLQRQSDKLNGSGDDAFCRGTSENDAVPSVCTDSIPPNKSDLTGFGTYEETAPTAKFLDLFWSRINNPSGTVTMDFELNKNFCDPTATVTNCTSNGVTPTRSDGDKLLVYQLDNGGTNATLSEYTWNAANSDWENQTTLSGGSNPEALGSINYDPIASGATTSITGAQDTLTFGEASIGYAALFSGNSCGTFGSVYLKSRSSSTFTDELKDFVKPVKVNISNCASVTTNATNGTIGTGNSISDKAILSGAVNPTGTITFDLYKFALGTTITSTSCTGKATSVAPYVTSLTTSTWTKNNTTGNYEATVTWSGASGTGLAAGDIGLYRWVVSSYSGDQNNVVTNPDGSALPTACNASNEASTVDKLPSTLDTVQKWYPNDRATLGGGGTGNLVFTLYKNDSTCGSNGANTTNAVTGLIGLSIAPTSGVAATNNGPGNTVDVPVTAVGSSGDTYYWLVKYAGDSSHKAVSSCVETTAFSSLSNGTQQSSS